MVETGRDRDDVKRRILGQDGEGGSHQFQGKFSEV